MDLEKLAELLLFVLHIEKLLLIIANSSENYWTLWSNGFLQLRFSREHSHFFTIKKHNQKQRKKQTYKQADQINICWQKFSK